jgi:glycyl-tRNA synthetase beta chain
MPDFLLEIGCEEIPARMIDAASKELKKRVNDLLDRERLSGTDAISSLDSPRRLAVLAPGISVAQPDLTENVTGPAVSVAFKDGQPTPAAHAFAKKAGVEFSALDRISTPKGEYIAARITKKGRAASEILSEALPRELAGIYWPKSMYWRKTSERFVRPVRWLVAMLDNEVIPLEFDGVRAGDKSQGHRILSRGAIQIPAAGSAYIAALERAMVLGRDAREGQIRKQLDAATRTIPGARWREDKDLLETVVNLTEFPSVTLGNFDPEFLQLPEEILVTVMRDHQKYFAVESSDGKLAPHFLAVLNTDGDPQGTIRHGHERVLRARFNDARFFWQTDQKHSLRERVDMLRHVTFQKDLGTYFDKSNRVQRLCSWLCEGIRRNGVAIRPGVVHKAACLAKTDLTTELVKEFTELQGIVGGLYARVQQLDPDLPPATRLAIADAIYDHYKPESMEDSVPRTMEGAVLSIGDKADSIAGMFALGLQPTGSKDPFALRRQANAIVRIIAEKRFEIPFSELFSSALFTYDKTDAQKKFQITSFENASKTLDKQLKGVAVYQPGAKPRVVGYEGEDERAVELTLFLQERISFYLKETLHFRYDVVNAVMTADRDQLLDLIKRAEAVADVSESADFTAIGLSFKRIKNILFKGPAVSWLFSTIGNFHSSKLVEPAELALYASLERAKPELAALRSAKQYSKALSVIASLRTPIDRFFDEVMVLCEDPTLRTNRLALLTDIYMTFSAIADFSEIVTEGRS